MTSLTFLAACALAAIYVLVCDVLDGTPETK